MENRVARKLGGYRTIASGAIFGDMDVDKSGMEGEAVGWKVDCKLTDAKSHAVNIEKFQKVREAAALGQIPAYFIEFRQYEETLFVTDEQSLFYLLQTIEDMQRRIDNKGYVYRHMDDALKKLEAENERLNKENYRLQEKLDQADEVESLEKEKRELEGS